MPPWVLLTATLPLLACAPVTLPPSLEGPSGRALCLALAPLVDTHAAALQADDVPDAVLISGARLVAGIDGGCRQ